MKFKLIIILTAMIYVNSYSQIEPNENKVVENNSTEIQVFPIPTSGILNIHSNNAIVMIEVFDMIGDLVYTRPITTGLKNRKIDISNLKSGIYFIKIGDDKENYEILKIVKE